MSIEEKTCLIYVSDMCTGSFLESDIEDAANGKQRPPEGTKCNGACVIQSDRWGSSFCYTEEDKSQWGAECIPCPGNTTSLLLPALKLLRLYSIRLD